MSPYADLEVMSLVTAWSHTFIKIDHDQSASLFQGGLLLVRSESELSTVDCPGERCNRANDCLDMAIAVDWDAKY